MMELVENHMLFGSPEPNNKCEDIYDWRDKLSEYCEYKHDGVCCYNPEDQSTFCCAMKVCPDDRWQIG